jgi:hypothetical protein
MTLLRRAMSSIVVMGSATLAAAQPAPPRPPVIDMHVHSINTTPEEVLSRMKALNIRYAFVAGLSPDLPRWAAALDSHQFLPSIGFPCPGGRAPFADRRCWGAGYDACLKALVDNGFARRIVFGSDFPNLVGPGIEAILAADFLNDTHKADILCGNAARFLRLDASVCAP